MRKFIRQVQASVEEIKEKEEKNLLIPSGSTLLNCACSGSPYGAYKAGTIVTLPGASASGKTMLLFTMFAEICQLKKFNNYELIYDDAEEALAINIRLLFGADAYERIESPSYTKEGDSVYSQTIQDFQNNILLQIKKGKSFVYALDSLDALSSDEEMEREYKKAILSIKNPEQLKELKGSYHTEKAKIIGQCLRMIRGKLKNTKSLLIIVQQERANVGGGMFQRETITSGGKAPFYYSSHQVWMKRIKSLKKNDKKIGNRVKAIVTKNKLTGKERNAEFDISDDYGVDDIGSQIDFLLQEGNWSKNGIKINAIGLNISGIRAEIISQIEKEGRQKELKKITGETWGQIESRLKLDRKPKYE